MTCFASGFIYLQCSSFLTLNLSHILRLISWRSTKFLFVGSYFALVNCLVCFWRLFSEDSETKLFRFVYDIYTVRTVRRIQLLSMPRRCFRYSSQYKGTRINNHPDKTQVKIINSHISNAQGTLNEVSRYQGVSYGRRLYMKQFDETKTRRFLLLLVHSANF